MINIIKIHKYALLPALFLFMMNGCDVSDDVKNAINASSSSSAKSSASSSSSSSSNANRYTFSDWKKECPSGTEYNFRKENNSDGSSIEIDECVKDTQKYPLRRLSILADNQTDSDEYYLVISDNTQIVNPRIKYLDYASYGLSIEYLGVVLKSENGNSRWWEHSLSYKQWFSSGGSNEDYYVEKWTDNDGGEWDFLTAKHIQKYPNQRKQYERFYYTLQHSNGYWYNPEANGTHWWDNGNLNAQWRNMAVNNPTKWDVVEEYLRTYFSDGHPATIEKDCVVKQEKTGIWLGHCATKEVWNDEPSYLSGVVYSEPWQNMDQTWTDIIVQRTTWYDDTQKEAEEIFNPFDNSGFWEAKLAQLTRWASDGTILEEWP